jgi:hypothetical protein
MKLSDIRYIKIPFTLYDLFGYLLPGLLFFALFPITYDLSKIIDIASEYIKTGNYCEKSFLLLQIRDTLSISPWLLLFYCILIAYLVGHIIATLSSLILERIFVEKFLKYPAANMFGIRKYQGWFENVIFKVINIIPGWKLFKKIIFPNYRRSYSKDFRESFQKTFKGTFDLKVNDQSDIFWLCFSFVGQYCPITFQRASHFLNLYGFTRNLSMMFFLFGIAMALLESTNSILINWWLISFYFFLGLSFFWQYLKFFRRLNDEVYRGFVSFVSTKEKFGVAVGELE